MVMKEVMKEVMNSMNKSTKKLFNECLSLREKTTIIPEKYFYDYKSNCFLMTVDFTNYAGNIVRYRDKLCQTLIELNDFKELQVEMAKGLRQVLNIIKEEKIPN